MGHQVLKFDVMRISPILSLACALSILTAQTAPTYDVASIHRTDPSAQNIHMGPDGPRGGLRTGNTSPLRLIAAAYRIQAYQIVDAPAWAETERYDVVVTPDQAEPSYNSASWNRNLDRLQAVLRDRFHLRFHQENRDLSIYALVEAKGGNKLKPHPEGGHGRSMSTNMGRQIVGTDVTMDMLADQLSMQMTRLVRNNTGLTGSYDLQLDWTPDTDFPESPVFNAITEQLGLRLEATKGPVPVYVIDAVDHPDEN